MIHLHLGIRMNIDMPKYKWNQLLELCKTLELIAHKQLRKVAFSPGQESFLTGYGVILAGLMSYEGNSYHSPRDDAPKSVDVFSDPMKGRYIHVGIGRPRAIWVLYPTKNGDVLCRGAVLPYHETVESSRLTDQAWREKFDGLNRPALPDWVKPIIGFEPQLERVPKK